MEAFIDIQRSASEMSDKIKKEEFEKKMKEIDSMICVVAEDYPKLCWLDCIVKEMEFEYLNLEGKVSALESDNFDLHLKISELEKLEKEKEADLKDWRRVEGEEKWKMVEDEMMRQRIYRKGKNMTRAEKQVYELEKKMRRMRRTLLEVQRKIAEAECSQRGEKKSKWSMMVQACATGYVLGAVAAACITRL